MTSSTMASCSQLNLLDFPDELLLAIIHQTTEPKETLKFALLSKRLHQLSIGSIVWQTHCMEAWEFWDESHHIEAKLGLNPLETDWHALFMKRVAIDRHTSEVFELLILTQEGRYARMNELAVIGVDVKDLLQGLRFGTDEDREDVLARRWHAAAVLDMMGRRNAIEVWMRMQRGEHVELEDGLAAHDEFVLGKAPGASTNFIKSALDKIARAIPECTDDYSHMTIRQKAVRIVQYLRDNRFVGLSDTRKCYALQHNFLSLALDPAGNDGNACLPLQSVAIFCAVARRLGIDARPIDFPRTVHAVITAPADMSLDGESLAEVDSSKPETMYMNPFSSADPIHPGDLAGQLRTLSSLLHLSGVSVEPANELTMVLRASSNILTSASMMQGPQGPWEGLQGLPHTGEYPTSPLYAATWACSILGDADPAHASWWRRRAINSLLATHDADLMLDIEMFADFAPRLLEATGGDPKICTIMSRLIANVRAVQAPKPRPAADVDPVQHRVGTYFRHPRHNYLAFILGWDPICRGSEACIADMQVYNLVRGLRQPFYTVM